MAGLTVWYTMVDPGGVQYNTPASISVRSDASIFQFGDGVAAANGFLDCIATVYPPNSNEPCGRSKLVSFHRDTIGIENKPFHVVLSLKRTQDGRQPQANSGKCAVFAFLGDARIRVSIVPPRTRFVDMP